MRPSLSRLLPMCLVLATACGALAAAAAPRPRPVTGGFDIRQVSDPKVRIPRAVHGQEAIQVLGSGLNTIAARYGGTGAGLANVLRQNRDLWVDRQTRLNYRCSFGLKPNAKGELIPRPSGERAAAAGAAQAPFPLDQTFLLHSLPASKKKIYLDFDGHLSTGTAWNGNGDINALPYSIDGDRTTFNDAEREEIQEVWQRVTEDYAPFDVDVTTEEPDIENLRRTSGADDAYGIRVICTPTTDAAPGAGGVAFLGSFQWDVDTGCWAFTESVGNISENIAEVVSHEVGHTVGLFHDGKTDGTEYFGGHNGWAPIMGVAYGAAVGQFSKGEYANANNLEDDFVTIPNNGLFFRNDDHGNGPSGATQIQGSNPVRAGVISNRTDVDYFAFLTGTGTVSFDVQPAPNSPNLNVQLALLNSNNQVIAQTSGTGMGAQLTQSVTPGTYYIRVDGEGQGNPLTDGYSDYDSLGQYTLVGTLPPTLFKVSGKVTFNGAGLPGVTLTGGNSTALTDSQGNYTLNNLFDGTNVIRPRKPGFAFTPASRTVVLGPDQTDINFTAEIATFTLAGKVTGPSGPMSGVKVTATGSIASEAVGEAEPNQKIKDNNSIGNLFVLPISANGPITGLSVDLDLPHTSISDLEVSLIHPDGTSVFLHNRGGGGADNLITSYPGGTQPVEPLGILNGKPAGGDWKLLVKDRAPQDFGTLRAWKLTVLYNANFVKSKVTDSNGHYEFTLLTSGIYRAVATLSGFQFNPAGIDAFLGPDELNANFAAYAIPVTPTGLTATAISSGAVDLAWSDNGANETGFTLERKAGGGNYAGIASLGANVTSYRDFQVSPNTSYSYRVRSLNTYASSSYSVQATARVLAAPTNLAANAVAGGAINLSWLDNASGETNYVIERAAGAGAWSTRATIGANFKFYVDTGLTPGVRYAYRVHCTAAGSTSSKTNNASAVAKN